MAVVLPFVATFVDKGTKQAVAAVKKVDSQWGKTGDTLKKAAVPAAAVGTALVAGLKGAKSAAGDAAKAQKVLNSAMKNSGYPENAKAAGEYAVAVSKSTGIDQNAIRMAEARLATNKTLAGDTEKLGKVTMLAADMSAQGFGTIESASATLTKALNDPVKGMAALARQGIVFDSTTQAAIKNAVKSGDMAAAQMMVLTQVSKTVGGAAEANASSTAKMRAQYAELATIIGNSLLPIFGALNKVLSAVITWMTEHVGVTKALILIIGGLVTAILGLNAVMWINNKVTAANTVVQKAANSTVVTFVRVKAIEAGQWVKTTTVTVSNSAALAVNRSMQTGLLGSIRGVIAGLVSQIASAARSTAAWVANTAAAVANKVAMIASKVATIAMSAAQKGLSVATKLMTAAQRGLNAAMKANPIGFVIGLVMALVTALAYAWKNSETFRRIVTSAFNAVKDVAQRVFSAIASAIQPVISLLQRIIDLAKNVAGAIGNVISKIPGLKNAQKEASKPLPQLATMMGPATRSTAAPAAAPIVINVSGALDPERVARQIRDLLDAHDIRQGRLVTRAVAW